MLNLPLTGSQENWVYATMLIAFLMIGVGIYGFIHKKK
jgi:LPXTG-motif cell wall-anchored protein